MVLGLLLWSWSGLCRLSLSKSQMFLVMSRGCLVNGSWLVNWG